MADNIDSLQKYLKTSPNSECFFLYIRNQNRKVLAPEITELECVDKLQSIDASDNPGLTIPESFDFARLSDLRILTMSRCGLTEFVPGFCDLQELQTLILSCNNIQKFPDTLASMQNLISLRLDGCDLESVPACIFTLPAIKKLNLEKNKLEEVPETFSALKKLTMLNLSYNQITEFPEVVLELPSLCALHLIGTKITQVPDTAEFLKRVNRIKSVYGIEIALKIHQQKLKVNAK